MACAIKSTSYSNRHSIISSISDFSLIMKLLVKDTVFDYQSSRRSNKLKFTNLYLYRTKSIVARSSYDLYQYKAYRNQKLRLSFNGRLPATEIGKKSDIDVMERIDLFHNSEIENDSDNNKQDQYLSY